MKNKLLTIFLSTLSLFLVSCGGSSKDATVFEITFKNTSKSPTFTAQNGARVTVAYSAMIGVVHTANSPIYRLNQSASEGLEQLAENGNPSTFISELNVLENVEVVGIANQSNTSSSGLLGPEESFTLLISASDTSSNLSLASSFVQANDIIIATPENGVPLFNADGSPISGNISGQMGYYDIGTEFNEAPGIGSTQVLRQGPAPEGEVSQGRKEGGVVTVLNDGFIYPSAASTIQVSIKVIDRGNLPPASPSPSPLPSPSAAEPTATATPSASASASSSPSVSASTAASPIA